MDRQLHWGPEDAIPRGSHLGEGGIVKHFRAVCGVLLCPGPW